MFRIGLGELERAGTLRVRHTIPADDPLWEGSGLEFLSGVDVDLTVSLAAAGEQVVARGRMTMRLGGGCRRCLHPVERVVDEPLDFVWAYSDEVGGEDDGEAEDEIRRIRPDADEIDVGEAVREEMLLSAPLYFLCEEGCKGLCPRCGVDLNRDECRCEGPDTDPRWAALRALRKE